MLEKRLRRNLRKRASKLRRRFSNNERGVRNQVLFLIPLKIKNRVENEVQKPKRTLNPLQKIRILIFVTPVLCEENTVQKLKNN